VIEMKREGPWKITFNCFRDLILCGEAILFGLVGRSSRGGDCKRHAPSPIAGDADVCTDGVFVAACNVGDAGVAESIVSVVRFASFESVIGWLGISGGIEYPNL